MLQDTILAALLTAGDTYVSGEQLAREAGVSRTAVWKAIEKLGQDGCEIEAVRNRGYRLTHMPARFCMKYTEQLTEGCRIPWQVQHYREVDSTNRMAKELAAQGAPEGLVLVADRQTAGRGRLGRHFHAPEGGLYMSFLLRPTLPISDMMAVTACMAAAVHCALKEFGITTQIKWVNDLYLNGRKLCGILSEGSFNAELLQMEYLVIGIGINLVPDPHLPEELRPIVTDLTTETGSAPHRSVLTAAILRHAEEMIDGIGAHTFLPVYTAHSCTLGHRVQVRAQRGECTALAVGFTEDAGLIVQHPDGKREVIRAGSAVIVG